MTKGRPSDRQLDRVMRMLEDCIEADRALQKQRRAERRELNRIFTDEQMTPFEKLKLLIEVERKWEDKP